jgi:hypothetical protein
MLALVAGLLVACSSAGAASPPLPASVKARVAALNAACLKAGGRPGASRHVLAQDFSGDARIDYLVSAGDYVCEGRPGLFRSGGRADVDIFISNSRGDADVLFHEPLLGYRLLGGKPVRIQIARTGKACGPASSASTQCGAELVWNGSAFDALPTGAQGAAAEPAEATATVARIASATGLATAGRPLALLAGAQAAFVADCRKATLAANPKAAPWVDGFCRDGWNKALAAGPMVDALLAAVPETAGDRVSVPALKRRLPEVKWVSKPPGQEVAAGTLGKLGVSANGAAMVDTVGLGWQDTGADFPYDAEAAMRARGAALAQVACLAFGAGEVTRVYVVRAPGRAAFGLTVYARAAPTANAWSIYSATADLSGVLPSLEALRARDRDSRWKAACGD